MRVVFLHMMAAALRAFPSTKCRGASKLRDEAELVMAIVSVYQAQNI